MASKSREMNAVALIAHGKPAIRLEKQPPTHSENHAVENNRPHRPTEPRRTASKSHGECSATRKPLSWDGDGREPDESRPDAEHDPLGEENLVVLGTHWVRYVAVTHEIPSSG